MSFSPGSGDPPEFKYLGPDDSPVKVKTNLRDLGVQLSSDLSFKVHVEKTVAGASKIAGWGLGTFRRRSMNVMKTIRKSLVRHKMD